jgi:hypothetical protein
MLLKTENFPVLHFSENDKVQNINQLKTQE